MSELPPVTFLGETLVSVDDKSRFAIPAAYRETVSSGCGNRLAICYHPYEQCLWILPVPVWEARAKAYGQLREGPKAHQVLKMRVIGAASFVEPDGNGRVLLPASLRSVVQIEKKAVLLGMNDKFELWSEHGHLAMSREPIREDQETEEMRDLKL